MGCDQPSFVITQLKMSTSAWLAPKTSPPHPLMVPLVAPKPIVHCSAWHPRPPPFDCPAWHLNQLSTVPRGTHTYYPLSCLAPKTHPPFDCPAWHPNHLSTVPRAARVAPKPNLVLFAAIGGHAAPPAEGMGLEIAVYFHFAGIPAEE